LIKTFFAFWGAKKIDRVLSVTKAFQIFYDGFAADSFLNSCPKQCIQKKQLGVFAKKTGFLRGKNTLKILIKIDDHYDDHGPFIPGGRRSADDW